MIKKNRIETVLSPITNPSILSIKLNALVKAKSHIIVKNIFSQRSKLEPEE